MVRFCSIVLHLVSKIKKETLNFKCKCSIVYVAEVYVVLEYEVNRMESKMGRHIDWNRSYTNLIFLENELVRIPLIVTVRSHGFNNQEVQEQLKLLCEEVEKLEESSNKGSYEQLFTWENIVCFVSSKKYISLKKWLSLV